MWQFIYRGGHRCSIVISLLVDLAFKFPMPNLGPLRRETDPCRQPSEYRCMRCREVLHFAHRHTSPVRLGAPLTTEFYLCLACDAGYAFNPATRKWRPWEDDAA